MCRQTWRGGVGGEEIQMGTEVLWGLRVSPIALSVQVCGPQKTKGTGKSEARTLGKCKSRIGLLAPVKKVISYIRLWWRSFQQVVSGSFTKSFRVLWRIRKENKNIPCPHNHPEGNQCSRLQKAASHSPEILFVLPGVPVSIGLRHAALLVLPWDEAGSPLTSNWGSCSLPLSPLSRVQARLFGSKLFQLLSIPFPAASSWPSPPLSWPWSWCPCACGSTAGLGLTLPWCSYCP